MSNMYQTTTLPPESVRFSLALAFFEKNGYLPETSDMAEMEEVVKYIYQSA